jgi:hypothetical protein
MINKDEHYNDMKNGYINEYKSFYNAYNNEIEVIKTLQFHYYMHCKMIYIH